MGIEKIDSGSGSKKGVNKKTVARLPRLTTPEQETHYHLTSRVCGPLDWFPFHDPVAAQAFLRILFHYASVYCCQLLDYNLMGNHFHLIVLFQAFMRLSRRELQRRAALLYPRKADRPQTAAQWRRFHRRLFSVSAFMHDVKQQMSTWYNKHYNRRGPLFAERFRSVILADQQALLDCMLYVDLNPVRAGLVEKPEDWQWSALAKRSQGNEDNLMPLQKIFRGRKDADAEYRARLYWRAGLEVNQENLDRIIEQEQRRGFQGGEYQQRIAAFSRGVALGSLRKIGQWVSLFRERGIYRRRNNPIAQLGGLFFTLTEQRGRYRSSLPSRSSPG